MKNTLGHIWFTRTWRWSIFSTLTISVLWIVFFFLNGKEMPGIEVVGFWSTTLPVFHLPFSISRWWDILFGPIYATLMVLTGYLTEPKNQRKISGEWILVMIVNYCIAVVSAFVLISGGLLTAIVTIILSFSGVTMVVWLISGTIRGFNAFANWANVK